MASWQRLMAATAALGLLAAPALGVNLLFPQAASKAAAGVTSGGELQLLEGALGDLATARADYKGHRVKAMQAIGVACTLLGGAPSQQGAGKPTKNQTVSDAQVRAAQASLSTALAMAGNQPRVKAQINTAINELNKALGAEPPQVAAQINTAFNNLKKTITGK